jgi:Kef-type K+ transport system membrane component KefB
MVVAQIGLAMAVISERLFGVVVFMSVMTTIIAPPLLNWAYRDVKIKPRGEEQYRIG